MTNTSLYTFLRRHVYHPHTANMKEKPYLVKSGGAVKCSSQMLVQLLLKNFTLSCLIGAMRHLKKLA